MPTLWIHRSKASSILVWFAENRREDAIKFAKNFLRENCQKDDFITEPEPSGDAVELIGSTNELHISITASDNFHPDNYRSEFHRGTWSHHGFVQVAEDEARDLGLRGEPEGFVPGNNQNIWKKDYRTAAEHDVELDVYRSKVTKGDSKASCY